MKRYLLLRNNQESGPYTIEELRTIDLYSLDLVWIVDQSEAWKYPSEIEELKDFVKDNADVPKKNYSFIENDKSSLPKKETEPASGTTCIESSEELKQNHWAWKQKQSVRKRRAFMVSRLMSVFAVFIGVIFGAFVMKKMVDDFTTDSTEETSDATQIINHETEMQPDENFENALVTEVVPVYQNTPAKTQQRKTTQKQAQAKNSKYKVGLFGGINGLQLTLFNTSSKVVDKALVMLDYFRPNGSLIQSEDVLFSSIQPNGAQTIPVPGANHGLTIRYKILKVYAHDYKAELKKI